MLLDVNENIKKQCLLDDDNRNIIIKISEIFDIILQYKKVFDVLYSFAFEINYENNINFKRIKNIEEYLKQINTLYSQYKLKIIEFIKIIDLIGKNNIKYLSMKLDYNYYYTNIEKEKNDENDLKIIKDINNEKIRQKILSDDDYNQSENSKNNYDDNNNLIDNNKFKNENQDNIQNNKNNENEMEDEDEKINNEEDEEEIKGEEYNNDKHKNNLYGKNDELNLENDGINDININQFKNMKDNNNNFIYKKYNIIDNTYNNNFIINNGNKNNVYNNKEKNLDINTNEDEIQNEVKTFQYENNDSNEKELDNENEEEENNLDDIDDEEDKIVTNIIPKIYGLSTKGKQQNDLDEKK